MLKFLKSKKTLLLLTIFLGVFFLFTPIFAATYDYCCVGRDKSDPNKISACKDINVATPGDASIACFKLSDSTTNYSLYPPTSSICQKVLGCPQTSGSGTYNICCIGKDKNSTKILDCKDLALTKPPSSTACDQFDKDLDYFVNPGNESFCKEVKACDAFAGSPASGGGTTQPAEEPLKFAEPKLQINIPTVQFSNITKDGEYIGVPHLAEYVAGVFKYAVGIISIVAIVMIMVGGLIWLTAGGSAGRVGKAKETITGAVLGLLLALGSYTVLYTINPDLVSFEALKIKIVQRQELEVIDFTNEDLKEYVGMTAYSGSSSVPYFVQWDDKKNSWANKCCGSNPSGCQKNTIARAGCGITSFAMVLKYYFPSQNIDPGTVSLLNPVYSCSIGNLSASKLSKWGPVTLTTMNVNSLDKIKTLVSQGNPVIINCHPCVGLDSSGVISPRKYGGHLMVLTGYNNGTFSVNDPGSYFKSMTTEMITNPCKFIGPSDNNSKASAAFAACNKQAANVNRPGFWYLRPAGK